MNQPTDRVFDSPDERSDFFVALVVIALFGLFIFNFVGYGADELAEADLIEEVYDDELRRLDREVRAADTPAEVERVPDEASQLAETELAREIEARERAARTDPRLIDTDGDGIADFYDHCPNTRGLGSLTGCPVKTQTDAPAN